MLLVALVVSLISVITGETYGHAYFPSYPHSDGAYAKSYGDGMLYTRALGYNNAFAPYAHSNYGSNPTYSYGNVYEPGNNYAFSLQSNRYSASYLPYYDYYNINSYLPYYSNNRYFPYHSRNDDDVMYHKNYIVGYGGYVYVPAYRYGEGYDFNGGLGYGNGYGSNYGQHYAHGQLGSGNRNPYAHNGDHYAYGNGQPYGPRSYRHKRSGYGYGVYGYRDFSHGYGNYGHGNSYGRHGYGGYGNYGLGGYRYDGPYRHGKGYTL